MVGPAPDKQMPSRPGCVDGDMLDRISGKAGICHRDSIQHERHEAAEEVVSASCEEERD